MADATDARRAAETVAGTAGVKGLDAAWPHLEWQLRAEGIEEAAALMRDQGKQAECDDLLALADRKRRTASGG